MEGDNKNDSFSTRKRQKVDDSDLGGAPGRRMWRNSSRELHSDAYRTQDAGAFSRTSSYGGSNAYSYPQDGGYNLDRRYSRDSSGNVQNYGDWGAPSSSGWYQDSYSSSSGYGQWGSDRQYDAYYGSSAAGNGSLSRAYSGTGAYGYDNNFYRGSGLERQSSGSAASNAAYYEEDLYGGRGSYSYSSNYHSASAYSSMDYGGMDGLRGSYRPGRFNLANRGSGAIGGNASSGGGRYATTFKARQYSFGAKKTTGNTGTGKSSSGAITNVKSKESKAVQQQPEKPKVITDMTIKDHLALRISVLDYHVMTALLKLNLQPDQELRKTLLDQKIASLEAERKQQEEAELKQQQEVEKKAAEAAEAELKQIEHEKKLAVEAKMAERKQLREAEHAAAAEKNIPLQTSSSSTDISNHSNVVSISSASGIAEMKDHTNSALKKDIDSTSRSTSINRKDSFMKRVDDRNTSPPSSRPSGGGGVRANSSQRALEPLHEPRPSGDARAGSVSATAVRKEGGATTSSMLDLVTPGKGRGKSPSRRSSAAISGAAAVGSVSGVSGVVDATSSAEKTRGRSPSRRGSVPRTGYVAGSGTNRDNRSVRSRSRSGSRVRAGAGRQGYYSEAQQHGQYDLYAQDYANDRYAAGYGDNYGYDQYGGYYDAYGVYVYPPSAGYGDDYGTGLYHHQGYVGGGGGNRGMNRSRSGDLNGQYSSAGVDRISGGGGSFNYAMRGDSVGVPARRSRSRSRSRSQGRPNGVCGTASSVPLNRAQNAAGGASAATGASGISRTQSNQSNPRSVGKPPITGGGQSQNNQQNRYYQEQQLGGGGRGGRGVRGYQNDAGRSSHSGGRGNIMTNGPPSHLRTPR